MGADGGEWPLGTLLLPAGTALTLLGVLVYLGALCAACRRLSPTSASSKSRKKKVPPDGVKLVDESLLRQTQLRSLSKSDTKLHELYRVKSRDDAQRPASLDFPFPAAPLGGADSVSVLLHRELPQIPVPEPPAASPAPEQTYSNLLFTPPRKPPQDAVYECLAGGGEDAPVPPVPPGTRASPPRAGHGAADYACVRKVKKAVPKELQDGTAEGPSATPRCWDAAGNAPRAKLEEMYSTVCKAAKTKSQLSSSSPREAGAARPPPCQEERAQAGCLSRASPGPPTPEPCYESIGDRAWTAQGSEPDYEAVDGNWKKAGKRAKAGRGCAPDNLYETVGDMWEGESRRGSARTAANGLEVYITNL